MSLQELEQDPFDPDEFLERLAWRTLGSSRNDADHFDPGMLKASFERTIQDLKEMDLRVQAQVEKLENQCKDEEKEHWDRVSELQMKNQVACDRFQELDERINFVATKVVHLGDQLEGVNTPRARAAEAQRLMSFFFLSLQMEVLYDLQFGLILHRIHLTLIYSRQQMLSRSYIR